MRERIAPELSVEEFDEERNASELKGAAHLRLHERSFCSYCHFTEHARRPGQRDGAWRGADC